MWEDMAWPTPSTVARTLPKLRPLLIQEVRELLCFGWGWKKIDFIIVDVYQWK